MNYIVELSILNNEKNTFFLRWTVAWSFLEPENLSLCICFCQKWDNSICRHYSADIQFLHPSNNPEIIKSLAFNILLTCIYNLLSIDLPVCVLKCPGKPALFLHLTSQNAVSWMQIIQATQNLQILGNERYCELLWKMWFLQGIWE